MKAKMDVTSSMFNSVYRSGRSFFCMGAEAKDREVGVSRIADTVSLLLYGVLAGIKFCCVDSFPGQTIDLDHAEE